MNLALMTVIFIGLALDLDSGLQALREGVNEVEIKKTFDMGLGVFMTGTKERMEKIFCVNESLAVHSDDANYLLEYVLKLDDAERLKAYLLYHKFALKGKSIPSRYLQGIAKDLDHPVYFGKEDWDLITSVFEYFDLGPLKSLKSKFEKVLKIFKGLDGLNKEMMEFDNYLWASQVVMSRSLVSFNKETQDYSYLFIPYIDLVNYWPLPKPKSDFIEVSLENSSYCLYTSTGLKAGDQIFIDYSIKDLQSFFINFGFVIENDPNLSLNIHLPIDPCSNCTVSLKPFEVNWKILQIILSLMEKDYNPELNFRKYMTALKDLYLFQDILTGVLIYRLEIVGMQKSVKLGLRELRRLSVKSSGKRKKILDFGSALRVLSYNHLKTLEKELIFAFYTYLLD